MCSSGTRVSLRKIKKIERDEGENEATDGVREVMGNLRFPLYLTYHGCPYLFVNLGVWIVFLTFVTKRQ
jgi:hypothetical protein